MAKILWMFTENPFESEKMVEHLSGNYLVEMAKESGFEVRTVNAWDAYQWLSPEITADITRTMQSQQISESVSDLLRLALLIEHGGVVVKVDQTLAVENLDWLAEHIDVEGGAGGKGVQAVLLSEREDAEAEFEYQDFFIAAVKGAELLKAAFRIFSDHVATGDVKLLRVRAGIEKDKVTFVTSIDGHLRRILHTLLRSLGPEHFSVASST
jgi:hypothetical protein